MDYSTGAGGASVESSLYGTHMPLGYVPAFGSGLPPTGMTLGQRAANAATFNAAKVIQIFVSAPKLQAMWCEQQAFLRKGHL